MGCFLSKQDQNVEVVNIEENNELMKKLKFNDKHKNKQGEIKDFHDFHYSGEDSIL